jgi:hypothetical protein
MDMRATLFTAAAVIPASATLGARAAAMTFFATPALRAAAADTALCRQAVVVCGINGWAQMHTARAQSHRPRP